MTAVLFRVNWSGALACRGYPIHDDDGYSASWHLKSSEVIVLLGQTPPECKYFSFTNYLYSRHMPEDYEPPSSPGVRYPTCLPGNVSSRCELFASVQDTVNLDRGLSLGEGSKFETSFALVISPSKRATEEAVAALIASGAPPTRISNFSYPGANMTLGVEPEADTFTTILRTAFFDNQTEAFDYFDELPFRVMRLEIDPDVDAEAYPRETLVPRKTGLQEGYAAGLTRDEMQNATQELALNAVDLLLAQDPDVEWEVSMSGFSNAEGVMDNGYDCIDNNIRCLADCRDTLCMCFTTEMQSFPCVLLTLHFRAQTPSLPTSTSGTIAARCWSTCATRSHCSNYLLSPECRQLMCMLAGQPQLLRLRPRRRRKVLQDGSDGKVNRRRLGCNFSRRSQSCDGKHLSIQ